MVVSSCLAGLQLSVQACHATLQSVPLLRFHAEALGTRQQLTTLLIVLSDIDIAGALKLTDCHLTPAGTKQHDCWVTEAAVSQERTLDPQGCSRQGKSITQRVQGAVLGLQAPPVE
eukprot:GHRR01019142.1.p2 GENE.GHRR01019142.1~~GHRR01019142.1.p2  ORF type:complete len:116 (-),score=33.09 GHRR01019142.1:722-1069(-)